MKKHNILIVCGLLVAVAVFLALFKGCKGNKGTDKSISIDRDTVLDIRIVSDTVRDTIWQKEYVYLPGKTSKELIHDTLWRDAEGLEHRRYQDSTEDETIKLNFTAHTTGKLDSIRFKYKLKAPKTIIEHITDSIYVDNTIIDKRYMPGFYLGAGALLNGPNSDIIAKASLTLKNNLQIGYGYGIKEKIHLLEVEYRIVPKKEK